jgi:hypothetical protein
LPMPCLQCLTKPASATCLTAKTSPNPTSQWPWAAVH